MPYFTPDEILKARQVDLLSYLQKFEPDNLVKLNGNNYCTKEHDSLKINNGKWYWFSRGFGGYSALDYLTKVKECPFTTAVSILTGTKGREKKEQPVVTEDRELVMPELNPSQTNAVNYLMKREIHPDLIKYCIDHGLIKESKQY